MSRLFYICLPVLLCMFARLSAQQPDWVMSHPVSDEDYIGVGLAPLTDEDYVGRATQVALSDIAGQISSHLDVSSFMHTIDTDGKSRELFEEKINSKMTTYLEGHKLIGSYSDQRNYYVCYSLNKKHYAKTLASHRQRVIGQAQSFYEQGEAAVAMNSLANATQFFAKGLEVVEPWLFADLRTQVGGRTIDLPTALYQGYLNIFDGLAITVSDFNVEGQPFKAIDKPLAACLSKAGVVVPNVKLKAWFEVGAGSVTPPVATDYNGTSEFYVTNITSKTPVQELRISIDDSFIEALPESYRQLLQNQTWPVGKITITLAAQPLTAYIYVSNDDLPSCKKQLAQVLSSNYFTISEDPDAAQCFVDLSTSLEVGGIVKGELYDMNECLCSLEVKIYNNQTQNQILHYLIDRHRVLSPADKGVEQTEAMCVRELMKRVRRELPKQIKTLNINQ